MGLGDLLVPDRFAVDSADDQVGSAYPAGAQAFPPHGRDQPLDVLAADGAEPQRADCRVDVRAEDRPVGGDAAVGAQMLAQPCLCFRLEQGVSCSRIDEDMGALVVFDLQGEVLGVALVPERLLAPPPGPPAGRSVADYPGVRARLPLRLGAVTALEDHCHSHTSRDRSHSSTCRSRNRR